MFLGGEQLNLFDSFDSFLYCICIVCSLLIVDHGEPILNQVPLVWTGRRRVSGTRVPFLCHG